MVKNFRVTKGKNSGGNIHHFRDLVMMADVSKGFCFPLVIQLAQTWKFTT